MKKNIITNVLLACLAISSANATVVVQSTLQTIPGTPSNRGGNATEVDYWYFAAESDGNVTIDTLSWMTDFDNDGEFFFFDPFIGLFVDDGNLDAGDLLLLNDDSFDTFSDGSVSGLDSYISTNLTAGNYVLAITDYSTTVADLVSGVNLNGFYPAYSSDGLNIESNYASGTPSYGDYQITFGGDVTVQAAVPEPSTYATFGLASLMLGFLSYRSRSRKS